MRKHFHTGLFMLLVMALAFCAQGQSARKWTAVGDDGMLGGPASGYVIAWSLDSLAIVNADADWNGWDTTAVDVWYIGPDGLPTDAMPGTLIEVPINLNDYPSDTVVFFSVKAFDDAVDITGQPDPNWSALGKILRVRTLDHVTPAAIFDLQ